MTVAEGSQGAAGIVSRFFRISARVRTLLILMAVATLSGLDQALFHGILALLRESRHLLNEDLGVATHASSVAFVVTLPLGGFLAHLVGPRRILLVAGILVACAACGMAFVFDARSYAGLGLIVGLAAGAVPGATATAIGFWFAPQEQGRAIACLQAAPIFGALIASMGLSNYAETWSVSWIDDHWRDFALGLGVIGVGWSYAALRWYSARPIMPGAAPTDPHLPDLPSEPLWPLGVIQRGGVLLIFAFIQVYDLGLGGGWLTAKLFTTWHLDLDASDFVAVAGLAGSLLGVATGGILSDLAFLQSGNVKSARQVVIGGGFFLGALSLLPLPEVHDLYHAGLWRAVSYFCLSLPGAPLWSIALTIAPGKSGPVIGMLGLGCALGLVASPAVAANWLAGGWFGDWGWGVLYWPGLAAAFVCAVCGFMLNPALEIEKPAPKPPPVVEEEED